MHMNDIDAFEKISAINEHIVKREVEAKSFDKLSFLSSNYLFVSFGILKRWLNPRVRRREWDSNPRVLVDISYLIL